MAPMTGYALKKHFDATVNHFWSADRAQLYRTLAALVGDGLATVEVVRQEKFPDRKEHHITESGRTALVDWLSAPLDDEDAREPFLARIFFAGRLDALHVGRILADRRSQAEALLARLIAERSRFAVDPDSRSIGDTLRLATLSHGIDHATAELAWLDETERSIAQ